MGDSGATAGSPTQATSELLFSSSPARSRVPPGFARPSSGQPRRSAPLPRWRHPIKVLWTTRDEFGSLQAARTTRPVPKASRFPHSEKGDTSRAAKFPVPGFLSSGFPERLPRNSARGAFPTRLPASSLPRGKFGYCRLAGRPFPQLAVPPRRSASAAKSSLPGFLREDLGGLSGAGGAREGAGRRVAFSAVSKGSIDLLSASGGGRRLQGLGGFLSRFGTKLRPHLSTPVHPLLFPQLCLPVGACLPACLLGSDLNPSCCSWLQVRSGPEPSASGHVRPGLPHSWGGFVNLLRYPG